MIGLRALRHRLTSLSLLAVLACGSSEVPQAYPGKPIGPSTAEPDIFSEPAEKPLAKGERRMPGGPVETNRVAVGINGAVSAQEGNASDVGVEILKKGGSSVDAAIAVGFALAVTHPSAGNIGGGGFMVIRNVDGTAHALDYREKAPKKASRDMYLDKKGEVTKDATLGPKSAGIPGTVAGFWLAHQKFGKLPWADVIAPAIKLAKEGVVLDKLMVESLTKATDAMKKARFDDTAKLYSGPKGAAFVEGDRWTQPELAVTLERISAEGPKGFYAGPTADALVKGVTKAGGIWTKEDLAAYEAKWRDPVVFDYRGHTIVTMPLPSAGGVVLKQALGMAELLDFKKESWRSVAEIHLMAEATRRAYADRNELLGDPEFVKVPKEIMSAEYIAARAKTIDRTKATPSTEVKVGLALPDPSTETTHYSVIDAAGNAVSTTYTLNTGFGAKFAPNGTGVLLNNEMDDFAVAPGKPNTFGLVHGEANRIEGNKRMLSSMTPTIILKDGEVRAVLGSPGGSTISTTVLQLTRALIDYDIPLDRAVPAPRAHHQWIPDGILVEQDLPEDVRAGLEKMGHKLLSRGRIGHANCIKVDPKTHGFRAVADTTRTGGKAAAY